MTWQSVGTHTFMPTDTAVQVGSFDLAAGQDTIWVRITQLNDPADWPFSYGILSWRNANGSPLGSIKAYSNRFGEVFRLGNGLPPSDGVGSIWFEPRGFNLAWLKAGFPWQLQFEAQAGASDLTSGYWNRDSVNGLITPKTGGDNLDMSPGWIKASNLIITDGGGGPSDRDVPGYQEGLWKPTMDKGTNSDNPGENVWSRVGNTVFLQGYLSTWTDYSTAGSMQIRSLPYSFNYSLAAGTCLATRAGVKIQTCFMVPGTQSIVFYQTAQSDASQWVALNYEHTSAATQIRFECRYQTDDRTWTPANNATVS